MNNEFVEIRNEQELMDCIRTAAINSLHVMVMMKRK